MKKVLAGIALLAVVATAQAGLLATWSTGGELDMTKTDSDVLYDVTDITPSGGAGFTTTGTFGVNKMNEGGGFEFTYALADGYTGIAGATVEFDANGSTTGPKQLDWYVDQDFVTSIVRTTTGTTSYKAELGDIGALGTVKMLANTAAGCITTKDFGTGGSLNMRSDVTFNGTPIEGGDPSAVPEPATMSLLGLGALAMVIRRKLRK